MVTSGLQLRVSGRTTSLPVGAVPCFPAVDPDVDLKDFFFPPTFLGFQMCAFYSEVSLESGPLTSKPRKIPWKKANWLHHCFYNSLV